MGPRAVLDGSISFYGHCIWRNLDQGRHTKVRSGDLQSTVELTPDLLWSKRILTQDRTKGLNLISG
jgi:hypothetical protein